MTYTLHCGDCLDILPTLPSGSIDAIICDLPYGTTACKWDTIIPFAPMWEQVKRVIKPRGAVVLFAAQPFTSALVMSNAGWFRYSWVWEKQRPTGFQMANYRPMKSHEDICTFSDAPATATRKGESMRFNPQGVYDCERRISRTQKHIATTSGGDTTGVYIGKKAGYPASVLRFSEPYADRLHPTQKPVELLRYLVRTYTNAGETVLDFTMGSGTTGVACAMEGRHFIGVELDAGYFDIAKRRIEQVQPALMEAAD